MGMVVRHHRPLTAEPMSLCHFPALGLKTSKMPQLIGPVLKAVVGSCGLDHPVSTHPGRVAEQAAPVAIVQVPVVTRLVRIQNAVATQLCGQAIGAAAIAGEQVAVVTGFQKIHDPISTDLNGLTIGAAPVTGHLVSIITDFREDRGKADLIEEILVSAPTTAR